MEIKVGRVAPRAAIHVPDLRCGPRSFLDPTYLYDVTETGSVPKACNLANRWTLPPHLRRTNQLQSFFQSNNTKSSSKFGYWPTLFFFAEEGYAHLFMLCRTPPVRVDRDKSRRQKTSF